MKKAPFQLAAPYEPTGDQPEAIEALSRGLEEGKRFQTLEGVTGSGKTFTVANVIARYGRPALVISHNKTLAAQLYAELKGFFPGNAVEYFVSYYDYYQPEAYIPQTDTFIEKDASINAEIERLRLAATDALMNREDVVIVASVSCIYGLGSPEDYREMLVSLHKGEVIERDVVLKRLVDIQYSRNDIESAPGTFRARGDTVDVFPSYSKKGLRIDFFDETVERIRRIDPLTGRTEAELNSAIISPAKHFVMPYTKIEGAIARIREELEERVRWFEQNNKLLEAQRIRMRTEYDIEMLQELGYCSGIENYSRHLSGRAEGERPATLLDFFQDTFLTILDESHVTVPQLRGMYNGDRARKETLVAHGFRLPSALDNRPMKYDEFFRAIGSAIFTTATPGPFEIENGGPPVQQVIRPTGILDPPVEVRPLTGQIDDLIEEVRQRAERKERVLVTTLTKKTAEDLSEYLHSLGLRVKYLHSEIDAIERVELLRGLRKADFDCLVGINLLREGLDIPEVSLVAILDADKEGYLRSETSLIQTCGRAARNINGRVIMYADKTTEAMRRALDEMNRRRKRQRAYNKKHNITARSIKKAVPDLLGNIYDRDYVTVSKAAETTAHYLSEKDYDKAIAKLRRQMKEAADKMDFEQAAVHRDRLLALEREKIELGL